MPLSSSKCRSITFGSCVPAHGSCHELRVLSSHLTLPPRHHGNGTVDAPGCSLCDSCQSCHRAGFFVPVFSAREQAEGPGFCSRRTGPFTALPGTVAPC